MDGKRSSFTLGAAVVAISTLMAGKYGFLLGDDDGDLPDASSIFSKELQVWVRDTTGYWQSPRYVWVHSRPGQLTALLERLRLENYAVVYSNNAQQRALLQLSAQEELLRLQRIDAINAVSPAEPLITTIEMRRLNARKNP